MEKRRAAGILLITIGLLVLVTGIVLLLTVTQRVIEQMHAVVLTYGHENPMNFVITIIGIVIFAAGIYLIKKKPVPKGMK